MWPHRHIHTCVHTAWVMQRGVLGNREKEFLLEKVNICAKRIYGWWGKIDDPSIWMWVRRAGCKKGLLRLFSKRPAKPTEGNSPPTEQPPQNRGEKWRRRAGKKSEGFVFSGMGMGMKNATRLKVLLLRLRFLREKLFNQNQDLFFSQSFIQSFWGYSRKREEKPCKWWKLYLFTYAAK